MQQLTDAVEELRKSNDAIGKLISKLEQRGNVHMTQRTDGGVLATAACFAMLVIVIAFMIMESRSYNDLSRKIDNKAQDIRAELSPQIDQLRAWKDVQAKEIGRLQAQLPKGK